VRQRVRRPAPATSTTPEKIGERHPAYHERVAELSALAERLGGRYQGAGG